MEPVLTFDRRVVALENPIEGSTRLTGHNPEPYRLWRALAALSRAAPGGQRREVAEHGLAPTRLAIRACNIGIIRIPTPTAAKEVQQAGCICPLRTPTANYSARLPSASRTRSYRRVATMNKETRCPSERRETADNDYVG